MKFCSPINWSSILFYRYGPLQVVWYKVRKWIGKKKFRFQERHFTSLTHPYYLRNGGHYTDLVSTHNFCEDKITFEIFEMHEPLYRCEQVSWTWKIINAPLQRGIDFMYKYPNISNPSNLFWHPRFLTIMYRLQKVFCNLCI